MNHDTKMFSIFLFICVSIFILVMIIMPHYNVYTKNLEGESNLRRQEWEKKIIVEDAKALLEASKLKAKAEVERAKGVAEANRIIGESLKDNEVYLKYLWVNGLMDGSSEVIYVPTEANLPILEAGKRVVGK